MIPALVIGPFGLALAAIAAAQQPSHVPGRALATRIQLPGNCASSGASHALTYVPGASTTNTFVTTADPDMRKFILRVPSSYSAQHAPYPVVYMLHGSGQTAQNILNNTTWNQAAEVYEFIAVYPEALPYLLIDGTVQTKWHTTSVEDFVVDPSELPLPDDVLFVREIHNTLVTHLNIDCDRVYASGFSNGGAFVKTEIRVNLADIFAATTSAGGIGVTGTDVTEFYPANGVDFRPHFELVGTKDDKKIANCVAAGDLMPGDLLPRAVAVVEATPCMWDSLTLFAQAVGQDPALYTTIEGPAYTQFLWNSVVIPGPGPTEYRFRILPNLTHEYPSGTNYSTDYVPIFYGWMSQFTR